MNPRAKQLLLEVLLLSERYSDRDIAWAREQLSAHRRGRVIAELLINSEDQTRQPENDRNDGPNNSDKFDLQSRKDALVKSLNNQRSSQSIRRAENIGERLKIPLRGQSHDELVREISAALDRMPPSELKAFLRPYKGAREVDQAYIGLAREIMKPSKG